MTADSSRRSAAADSVAVGRVQRQQQSRLTKAAGNALTACDRVERIWRHQCTQVLEELGSRMPRSRLRRSRWDAERPMEGLEPSALRGGRWRARQGRSP